MNREDFLETIRKQYADEIHTAYLECEHTAGKIDYKTLRTKLGKLMKSASVEGLQQKDFIDLVESTLSADTVKALKFTAVAKAA